MDYPRRLATALAALVLSFPSLAQETSPPAPAASGRLNPDISVNLLGVYRRSNRSNFPGAVEPNGFALQEAELQFTSAVDPYLRAAALFAIAPDAGGFAIEPEELYVESTSLPVVTARLGKFRAALGRHNLLHAHAYPFIDAPLANVALLGEEGLADTGASLSALLPVTWFSELTVQAIANDNAAAFDSDEPNSLVTVARLRNLWDLTDDLTLDLGASGAFGPNSAGADTSVAGGDLTFKWRPAEGGKYRALAWTTEYLAASDRFDPEALAPRTGLGRLGGFGTWVQYQFARRWWAQVRAEWLGLPRPEGTVETRRWSGLLGFFPSEFSGFRAQYDHLDDGQEPREHRLTVQWNISVGAHPAHAY